MSCASQEILVELAFALVNGESVSSTLRRVLEHAQGCPACGKGLHECVETLQRVRQALARNEPEAATSSKCLSDDVLAGYTDGTLGPPLRQAAEEHLGRCRHCLEQVIELAEVAQEAAQRWRPHGRSNASLLEYVIGIGREGLRFLSYPAQGFSMMDAQPAQVLGPQETMQDATQKTYAWTQFAEELELTFSMVHVDLWHVNLSVRAAGDRACTTDARLTLRLGERIVQSERLSEAGAIVLQKLEIGCYDGEITLPSGKTVAFLLDLRPL